MVARRESNDRDRLGAKGSARFIRDAVRRSGHSDGGRHLLLGRYSFGAAHLERTRPLPFSASRTDERAHRRSTARANRAPSSRRNSRCRRNARSRSARAELRLRRTIRQVRLRDVLPQIAGSAGRCQSRRSRMPRRLAGSPRARRSSPTCCRPERRASHDRLQ